MNDDCIKWPIFTQTGKIEPGKNTKYLFFLLGLKYTLRTCFESKHIERNLNFDRKQHWAEFGDIG